MYDVELLSMRDIAKRLGVAYGTVQRIVTSHTTPRPAGSRKRDPDELAPCGTKNAYQRHLDRGEEPDELCKQANRDHTNEFNRRTGISRARNRAYRRLARAFSEIFDVFLAEEKERAEAEQPNAPAKVLRSRARERAHRRLVRTYPDVFAQILAREKTIAQAEAQHTGQTPAARVDRDCLDKNCQLC